jgi:hypothetical protein
MLLKMDNRTLHKLFPRKYFWESTLDPLDPQKLGRSVLRIHDSTYETIDKTIAAFEELEKLNKTDILVSRYVFMHLLRCKQSQTR